MECGYCAHVDSHTGVNHQQSHNREALRAANTHGWLETTHLPSFCKWGNRRQLVKAKLFNLSAPWTLFLLWSLGECKDLPGRKVQSITLFIINEEAPYPKGVLKHHLQPWLIQEGIYSSWEKRNLMELNKESPKWWAVCYPTDSWSVNQGEIEKEINLLHNTFVLPKTGWILLARGSDWFCQQCCTGLALLGNSYILVLEQNSCCAGRVKQVRD